MKEPEQKLDYEQAYAKLLGDPDFDHLELELVQPNIFDILKVSRYEIRHSNFLEWLLNPNANHELGNDLLKRILRHLSLDPKTQLSLYDVEGLDYSSAEVRTEWHRIDLLVLFDDLVVCIENKINIQDHSNQLARYKATVEKEFPRHTHVFVYLTPHGVAPTNNQQDYINLSYSTLIQQLEFLLQLKQKSMNLEVAHYIGDYIISLKRNIMGDDNSNLLAQKIYRNHKELFDFVFDNKPDAASAIQQVYKDIIEEKGWLTGSKNKGYLRFTTPKLDALIPKKKVRDGWRDGEHFLFEINFWWSQPNTLFLATIAPGDERIRNILKEVMENLKTNHEQKSKFKKTDGVQWVNYYHHKKDLDVQELMKKEPEELRSILHKFVNEHEWVVSLIEEKILERAEEMKAINLDEA